MSFYIDPFYYLEDPISTEMTQLLSDKSIVTLQTNGQLTFGKKNNEVGDWFYIRTIAYLDTYPEHSQDIGFMYFEMVDSCLYTQIYPLKLIATEHQFKVEEINYNDTTSIFSAWFPADKSTFGHKKHFESFSYAQDMSVEVKGGSIK